jgi:hypothetical protein
LSPQNKIINPSLTERTTMADLRTGTQTGSGSSPGFEKAATAAKSVTDQALSASREIKDKAVGLAAVSSETIKDQASEFVDAAKDVASQARDKLKQTVDSQKSASADYVGSLAGTIRRAAKEFDGDLPIAGLYPEGCIAGGRGGRDDQDRQLQTISCGGPSRSRDGSRPHFSQWRSSPGFGVVRFLKSSANETGVSAPQRASSNTGVNPRPLAAIAVNIVTFNAENPQSSRPKLQAVSASLYL